RYKVFPLFYGGGKKAAWDPWSNWYMGLWLGFSTLGPAKTDITAYLSWQTELFPLSGTASTGYSSPLWGLSGDQYRQDNLLGAALSLSRSFLKGNIRASITARYTKNQSNAQYFDYDRFSLVFSVSGKLDRDWEKP
ncbi:hypothetical protein KKF84_01395, partial [Myxococcota bacterium]|nr:hypothetical protein [Myxococcota bacterium]